MPEGKQRDIFNYAPFGVYRSTVEGRLVEANLSLARMFGYDSPKEMIDEVTDLGAQLFVDPAKRGEVVQRAVTSGEFVKEEVQYRRRDGQEIDAILQMRVVRGEDGRVEILEGFLEDITAKIKLERELARAQRLESIGTLAGGIAHDFNNILGIIMGNAALIESSADNREKLLQRAKTITEAAERGTSLVKQMLTFGRKSKPVFTPLSINRAVDEVTKLLNETFPKTMRVLCNLSDELPLVNGDPTQIHQVLLNLCVNARDAMKSSGDLILKTEVVSAKVVRTLFPTAASPGYVLVGVSDNGEGMSKDVIEHIFEPFFTTKEPGKGTGLGLSVVYGIMEGHHGFVNVASEPGKGTTFSLYFPVQAVRAHPGVEEETTASDTTDGAETILLIEDEEMLNELAVSILSSNGYKVLSTYDGKEAVEVYKKNKDRIALVLSDFGLPKLTGGEVLAWLKEINTDVKFVLATGYIDPSEREAIIENGAREIVMKPYRPADLLGKVRKVLDMGEGQNDKGRR